MSSVGEDFPKEQKRVRELVEEYQSLPNGVGMFGAAMLKQTLAQAEEAIASGDPVAIIRAYEALKECE